MRCTTRNGMVIERIPMNQATPNAMLTTNMPELVHQLNRLTDVHVRDNDGQLELRLPVNTDMAKVDELICDAVFAEPTDRTITKDGWLIHMDKLDRLRHPCADMRVQGKGGVYKYILSGYAA